MAQFLRTATPDGDWRSFKFTHAIPGLTMTEGELYQIQDTVGVLILDIQYTTAGCKDAKTIEEDDEGVLIYHAEKVRVDKLTTFAILPGDKIYWSGVQGSSVTNVFTSGALWIGICVWPAALADETVIIDLLGNKATNPNFD